MFTKCSLRENKIKKNTKVFTKGNIAPDRKFPNEE